MLSILPAFEKVEEIPWNEKCEKAFQDLKEYLMRALMLTTLKPEEDLYMYLSMSEHAVSTVLLRYQGVQ